MKCWCLRRRTKLNYAIATDFIESEEVQLDEVIPRVTKRLLTQWHHWNHWVKWRLAGFVLLIVKNNRFFQSKVTLCFLSFSQSLSCVFLSSSRGGATPPFFSEEKTCSAWDKPILMYTGKANYVFIILYFLMYSSEYALLFENSTDIISSFYKFASFRRISASFERIKSN